jgi:site-specific DNA-methyltransferase (adenine-specific)
MSDGKYAFEKSKIIQGDCLEKMKLIPDRCIDMILCDLPYGTTSCKWDSVIDLDLMWIEYKRIIKPYGAIVMFGSQPFTTTLISSNIKWFKYSWVWRKNRATGHVHAKNRPMKQHEDICVFSEGNTLHKNQSNKRMAYYPQGLVELPINTKRRTRNDAGDNAVMGKRKSHKETITTHTNYPISIIDFNIEMNGDRFHETQKPLDCCKYLIETYSKEGDIVLDNTAGGGQTGIACIETNRDFILIEKELNYYEVIKERVGKIFKNYEIDLQPLLDERM